MPPLTFLDLMHPLCVLCAAAYKGRALSHPDHLQQSSSGFTAGNPIPICLTERVPQLAVSA